jgi:predicted AAA+ superfamily ATPase
MGVKMYSRKIEISEEESFFLFGARGTGKSTLLDQLDFLQDATRFDLLDQDIESEFSLRPQLLYERCELLKKNDWVCIDEVQKIPELLDVVHSLIEKKKLRFVLTGSSSRKLKRKGANLLAGRAFMNTLFPLTHQELGKDFNLDFVLNWGSLPKIFSYEKDRSKANYLKSYVQTYIKEEIVAEQLVRNLTPFRLFLPIAAQMNSKTLNFSLPSD